MPPRLAPDVEPIPGYRLIERLGRGGFGEVWKAEAPGGMLKAIKFVYGNLDEATENGKPAEQELKALNRVKSIRHPYILSLERFDIIEGQLLIVMELADRNLYDRFRECREQGLEGIPREELLRYLEESAEALDLMNSQFQLQHLDIKPQNLFLVFNHVKVADFGLAKDLEGMQATLTGGVTPVYAAPETFECRVTRYCDQYSLAIVYQELLTGQRPFNGTTARQLMMQHIQAEPDLSSLPEADRPIIARALSKKPEERFPTCADMIRALRETNRQQPVVHSSETVATPASTPIMRTAPPALGSPLRRPGSFPGLSSSRLTTLPSLSGRSKLPPLTGGRPAATTISAKPAPPERSGDGALIPTVLIGLGQYGLVFLHRLRRALRERFGCVTLPHLRMLYIDTDGESIQQAPLSSTSLEADEVYLAKLNRPGHYSKSRPDLPDVSTWLNPQMLYRIPRQPATTGIRAFGRLALCDHYRALMARFRSDVETCVADKALDSAQELTGQKLRTNRPRVYLVTSSMGGTGSGMVLDLAYAVRFQLRLMGYTEPQVNGLLFVPHVDAETPRSQAVANTYAALSELYHFTRPDTTYEALFDSKEGPIVDQERPFQRCLILPLPKTGEAKSPRKIVGIGVNSLLQELFSPLGREAEKSRQPRPGNTATYIHTRGSFRFAWPRRTLLERASRRACERLLETWTAREAPRLVEPVRAWLDEQWEARQLGPEPTLAHLQQRFHEALGSEPLNMITDALASLEDRSRQTEVDVDEIVNAVQQLTQYFGTPENNHTAAPTGRMAKKLEPVARTESAEIEKQLLAMAGALVEAPSWRLPAAEELIRQLNERYTIAVEQMESVVDHMRQSMMEVYVKALSQASSLEEMSRGTRKAAIIRECAAHLRQFAAKRIDYLQHRAVLDVFRSLGKFAPEFQRDLQQARQRLEEMRELLSGRSSASSGQLGPERLLLPPGCQSLDEAAERIAAALTLEDLTALDQSVHTELRRKFPGLLAFCQERADQTRALVEVLLQGIRPQLEPRLGPDSAGTAFLATFRDEYSVRSELEYGFDEATPDLLGTRPYAGSQMCYIGVSNDVHGQRIADIAQVALESSNPSVIHGTEDVLIIREYQHLSANDLPQLSGKARETFVHITHADQAEPFARQDVSFQTAVSK